jgi:2,3-bisphosphoglycerate-independent phosphoglycerate mutase
MLFLACNSAIPDLQRLRTDSKTSHYLSYEVIDRAFAIQTIMTFFVSRLDAVGSERSTYNVTQDHDTPAAHSKHQAEVYLTQYNDPPRRHYAEYCCSDGHLGCRTR